MDLRAYYKRLREIEASLPEESVLLASVETPGVMTEANRSTAAKAIARGKARQATAEEASAFRLSSGPH